MVFFLDVFAMSTKTSATTESVNLEMLPFLGQPLEVLRFTTVKKKGKFGEYDYGQNVLLSNSKRQYNIELPRNSLVLAAIRAMILENVANKFVFEFDEDKKVIVSAALSASA